MTELGSNFNIRNVTPVWTFETATGGIQFNYVGDNATLGDCVGPGDSLTFDFVFDKSYILPDEPFSLWTSTSEPPR